MKKLLIPVIIAVLAGLGGGSGFSYMKVAKKFVADSIQLADSLKAHPPADSTAHDTTAASDAAAHGVPDSAMIEIPAPETPADSIRALEASRESLRAATKGVPDASDHDTPSKSPSKAPAKAAASDHAPANGAPGKGAAGKGAPAATDTHAPAAAHDAPTPAATKGSGGKTASDAKSAPGTASVANAVRDARNDAIATALPEQRLAKIFGAMSAKDAAKVMEQMPDSDVRTILSLMSDRSAAAILTQFPAARAAAITKGAARAGGSTP